MENHRITQNYESYLEADHQTWNVLFKRQERLDSDVLCDDYLDGYRRLELSKDRIVKIDQASDRLFKICQWSLIPVSGIIPAKDFFYMLCAKQYPINVSIRKPHELDFSEQPDIFHDVLGHVPLLMNPKFSDYLESFSRIALAHIEDVEAINCLSRLYWYTFEMGIIREGKKMKPYGGAIITSSNEILNMRDSGIPKYDFDIDHIFATPYDPFKLQNEYFVINSFADLFGSLEYVESKFVRGTVKPEIN